jgi:hypothetical protein
MTEKAATQLKEVEDDVNLFLSGGPCHKTQHDPASKLAKLIMWKMLTLEFLHLSRNPMEIERKILEELKRI